MPSKQTQAKLTPQKRAMIAREETIREIRKGATVAEALRVAGRSRAWYEEQRRHAAGFKEEVDQAKFEAGQPMQHVPTAQADGEAVKDFADFRRRFLRQETFPHQQAWIDVLEGRPPQIQPGWLYEPAEANRLLINTPPNHAKSMTLSIDYVTYRLCMDPNVRVMLVSKTQAMSKKFLYAVKQRLTHPRYLKLQATFGPEGGFKAAADSWSATAIYLGGDAKDSGEKDPTVEAVGMGGQIYGSRADLIILDDCVVLANAHQWESQMEWIRQEVESRLGPDGILALVGTRVAAVDLYREIRNPDHYTDGESPWTRLSQPAVLDDRSNDPEEWVTLWPWSDVPFDPKDKPNEQGWYPRWTGPRLKKVRNSMGPQKWALVYQQRDVSADSVFDPVAIQGSVDGDRTPGMLSRDRALNARWKNVPTNPDALYRVCSMDPAMAGDTAAVAYAVDRQTGMRYILDVAVMTGPTPAKIRELIENWTEEFKPHEWVIESNAFQLFLTKDEDLNRWLASRGVPLVPHYTGRNKIDPEFGVASLAPLLGTVREEEGLGRRVHNRNNLVSIPDTRRCVGARMLTEQLLSWDPRVPARHRKQDTVMAWWFAELRARKVLNTVEDGGQQFYYGSRFTSERERDRQAVISLDEIAAGVPTMGFL